MNNMRRILIFTSILALELSFAAIMPVGAQNPPAQPPAPPEEAPSVLAVPKAYRYSARARRDPFVNPVPKPKQPANTPPPVVARPPGLRGVLVADAQIAGVVTSREPSMNVVIISAPGAKTPYFGRVGDQLYDGFIKSIQLDAITFAQTAAAGGDEKASREIVRRVRPTPGEDQ
jgi:hypothetical protein